jgi:leader peptidase (prepilin peptidase)/N-methyltransferase
VGLFLPALVLLGLAVGPWLALVAVRLAGPGAGNRPSVARAVLGALAGAGLLVVAVAVTGYRPAAVAVAWFLLAGLVLAQVDLDVHRLPDVVTYPAFAGCGAALLVDAAVLDSEAALLRGLVAAVVAFGVGAATAAASPRSLGFGDVKLLALLGLVLGWFGWSVLIAGVFFGLLAGALAALVLVGTRRAGWRTAVPFGPPLLLGAAIALAASGSLV